MCFPNRTYLVANIVLPQDASTEEAFSVSRSKLKAIGVNSSKLKYSIYRRSVDARKKTDIKFVYSVSVTGDLPQLSVLKRKDKDITELVYHEPVAQFGEEILDNPIVIVGTGPCGLFAGLFLAENGYRPILIERGGNIAQRIAKTEQFKSHQILDTNTNIQFGAGGAGTFSDGKLVTRINDSYSDYVLKRFVEFGAPDEIMYLAKPHVGTDVLSGVVDKILERIEALGGKVMYHTRLIDFCESSGRVTHAITDKGKIACSALLLAIGHSARDTYSMLLRKNLSVEPKQFSVGMRIEHKAKTIDEGLYGDMAGKRGLSHGEYNLSYNTKKRGVYTFCMCPGGVVVPAASEDGGVVVNGMSYHSRDGENSNSAVVCTIFKEDYGATPNSAIEFQRNIERAAFKAGGSDYSAPIVTVGDFISGQAKTEPYEVRPTYMNGKVKVASPKEYLPDFVTSNIKDALIDFGHKIPGFSSEGAVLCGAETRTSAPIRILRSKESGLALGYSNIYPSGEGAGYAGGITSAAIDGLKTAIRIAERYKPYKDN